MCTSRRVAIRAFVLCLIAGAIELYAVYVAGSVALFSDVVHISSDALSYLVSIVIIGVALAFPIHTRKATVAGVALMFIFLVVGDVLIFREAIDRIFVPHEVFGLATSLAASAGFILNGIVLFLSRKTPLHEQNILHASIDAHALSDLAVSAAVILAALIVWLTDFHAADWIVALGVAFYLFLGPIFDLAWRIVHGNARIHGHNQG